MTANTLADRRYLIPFRSQLLPQIFTDVLVIGCGVAGLRAAIEAAERGADVIVLSKAEVAMSNTAWAQGGIAAVLSADDTVDAHAADTLAAGAGLCDESSVRTLVSEGPDRVHELIEWGMRVDRSDDRLDLGREGGHHAHRILHSDGDKTGLALVECLLRKLRSPPTVRLFDRCFALDLLTSSDEQSGAKTLGAITHHARYGLQIIWAGATILASGGAGLVYRETTNPRVATGDGMAMAFRAGATLSDMGFMQFHPTTLYVAGATRALITEAIRGEGAYLVDRSGRRFMPTYHEMAELAPRDVVSRAIVREIARSPDSCVYLDVRHIGGQSFAERFTSFSKLLQSFDIDPGSDLIPVQPAAHYMIGGVRADADGRTTLSALFACGEVSCSGVHGANRLASNSLLEGLVFGRRCGRAAADIAAHEGVRGIPIVSDIRPSDRAELDLTDVRSSVRSVMWRNVGIERSGAKLHDSIDMFDFWARYTMDKVLDDPHGWETQNLLTVASLIARSAAWREESRGVHFRLDHADPRESYALHDDWTRFCVEPTTRPAVGVVEV